MKLKDEIKYSFINLTFSFTFSLLKERNKIGSLVPKDLSDDNFQSFIIFFLLNKRKM